MQSSIIVKKLRLNLNKMIAQTWTFFLITIYKAIDKKALDKYMYGFLGVLFTFGTVPILNDVIFRKFNKLNKCENIIFISYNKTEIDNFFQVHNQSNFKQETS